MRVRNKGERRAGVGRGGGVGRADEMEWAEWSFSAPAPESHYFWYPEGLVYL